MSTPVINTPTIGRRVWYWPSARDLEAGMERIYSSQPFDAGVSCVHGDSYVNLDICDHKNGRHGASMVPLHQADDAYAGTPGTAQWMPYQAAQAKKQAPVPAPPPQAATGSDFSAALGWLKAGLSVQRVGWNGKGLWIEMQRPDANSKMTLPYLFLNYPGDAQNTPGARVPWVTSQTDVLADDWQVVSPT